MVAMFNSPVTCLQDLNGKRPYTSMKEQLNNKKILITRIYSGQAGGFFAPATNFIGEMLGIKSLPIEFGVDGKRRWLKVKDSRLNKI